MSRRSLVLRTVGLVLHATLLISASAVAAAQPSTQTSTQPAPLSSVTHGPYLLDINLSDETVRQIMGSDYDLVVLDYVSSERNNTTYPMADTVRRLHTAPKPKVVLAYIDIGQAENYRGFVPFVGSRALDHYLPPQ